MNEDLIKSLEKELRERRGYGNIIEQVNIKSHEGTRFDVDIVARLEDADDKRQLGKILGGLSSSFKQSGLSVEFHQYHPKDYKS